MARGIFYDRRRRRYRVRVYHKNRVIHLSYHRRKPEALMAWLEARSKRHVIRSHKCAIHSTVDQVRALRDNLV